MLNLKIDSRPLIPLRMVPLVTGWNLSPAKLSGALCGEIKALKGRIQAHRLGSDGTHEPMPGGEWQAIYAKALTSESESAVSGSAEGRLLPLWCREAIQALPAGAFLWLEDLEKLSRLHEFASETDSGDSIAANIPLNFTPWIPPDLVKSVYEGFKELLISSAESGRRQIPALVRSRELATYLRLDPFYGLESDRPEALIEEIYADNAGNPRFQNFRRRYLQIPFKNQNQHHLILLWCSLMGLPAYRDSQPLLWEPKEFLDHWTADLDLKCCELKEFLRSHGWLLPTWLFPTEIDNTHRKLALDKAAYDAAVHGYLEVLPKLQAELVSLQAIQPESLEARQKLKEEALSLERRIDRVLKRDVLGKPETSEEREQRLKGWFAEEQAKATNGALKRTAEREGITRQTLSKILKR